MTPILELIKTTTPMENNNPKKSTNFGKREKSRYLRGDWIATFSVKGRGQGPAIKGYPASLQPSSFKNDMIKIVGLNNYYKLRVNGKRKWWAKVTQSSAEKAIKEQWEKLKVSPDKQMVKLATPCYKVTGGNLSGNNLFVRHFAKTERGKIAAKNKESGLLKVANEEWKALSESEKQRYHNEAQALNEQKIQEFLV